MNRKFVAGLAGLSALALVAGPALAGQPDGTGAQKSPLFVVDQNMDCSQSNSPGAPAGFVILNSTNKPGDAGTVLGEVSLKNADPNATYTVNLQSAGSSPSSSCMSVSMVTTNEQGNGNGHIPTPPTAVITDTAGIHQYYVVLQEQMPDSTATKTQLQSNVVNLD